MLSEHIDCVGQERRCLHTVIRAFSTATEEGERTVSLEANNRLMSWSRMIAMSGGRVNKSMVPGLRITIKTVCNVLQERALVVLDLLSFLGHLALVFQCTLDQRSNPFFDNIPVLLGSITERFKERPESTPGTPLDRNLLDFPKCVHEAIESIGTIRQSIKVVSEEEFGCGIDREASG